MTAERETPEDARERLIANLSWWSGWCTDNEGVLPELTKLGGRLLDARHMLAMDRVRVVSTVAELDALPDDTIIRSQSGSAWRKDPRAPVGEWTQTRNMGSHAAKSVGLPAIVLWVGGTE